MSGIHARAVVAAEVVNGRTRCTTLRSDPPLTLRETAGAVHLVGSAAGPVGGDRLELDVEVGRGADLEVRSVAAGIVLPGPTGGRSTARTRVTVAPAASLRWFVGPTVLVAGCDHHATTSVHLDAGASVVWRDEVVLGRTGEPSGSLFQGLRVDLDGRPLVRSEVGLGPVWPGSAGPAGSGGAGAVGSLLAVGPPARSVALPALPPSVRAGVFPLRADAVLVTVLGARPGAVAAVLDRVVDGIDRVVDGIDRASTRRPVAVPAG